MSAQLAERQERIDNALNKTFDAINVLVDKGDIKPLLPGMKDILTDAFTRNLYKRRFKMLANSPSWHGFKKRDGSVCESSRAKSMAHTVGKMLSWHNSGGYLGTIINANSNARSMCEAFGFVGETGYRLEREGMLTEAERKDYDTDRGQIVKRFVDNVESFVMVLMLVNGGKSRALDAWSKALYGK